MALVLSAALMSAGTLAPTVAAARGVTPSRGVAKQLKAAAEAIQERDYDTAFAKLKQAEAFPKKTALDQHLINDLTARAYLGKRNYDQAIKYFDTELGDGFLKAPEEQRLVKYLATLSYSLRNYDKTISYGDRAIRGGYADQAIYTAVGQAYYQKGDWKGTRKFEEDLIKSQTRHGGSPKPEALELLLTACQHLADSQCQTRTFEQLVQFKPQYWENLLYGLANGSQLNDRTQLQLYRLMLEVNVLKHPEEYTDMAQMALEEGSPGEAEQVIEKGFENKVFTDQRQQDKNHRLLADVKKAAAADMPKLAQRAAKADAAATGDADVAVGYDYLGYQQYDKAASYISKGLAKGVKDEAGARMLLGIAQLKGGHKDQAIKTFHSIKGGEFMQRLASLWTLHAKQPAAVVASR